MSFEPSVAFLRLYNDLPAQEIGVGQVMVDLGDIYSEEARKVLLKFNVPALASLGLAHIATLELAYFELPGLAEHLASLPISLNVVAGDEVAGRMPHPSVQSEVLFQEAQDVKRQASEAFEHGNLETGRRLLGGTKSRLARAIEVAPEGVAADIRAELADVDRMDSMTESVGSAYLSKVTRGSYHRMNRKRGRFEQTGDETHAELR